MNTTIDTTITNQVAAQIDFVNNCFPSLFTKEDVVSLLYKLQGQILQDIVENEIPVVEDEVKRYTLDEIEEAINNMSVDGDCFEIDHESADFEINHNNKVVLNDVEVELCTEEIFNNLSNELVNIR